jgi:hypothetical protein
VRWLLLSLLVAGCASELRLRGYEPLVAVREVPSMPGDRVTTIYGAAYVRDLGWFESLDATYRDALLKHEQVHSRRQMDNPLFFVRYGLEKDFRWEEEKLGHAEEIRALKQAGRLIDTDAYVRSLSGPTYLNMVSAREARAWVEGQ